MADEKAAHKGRSDKGPVIVQTGGATPEEKAAFKAVAGTKAGRAVFKWFMKYCGFKESSLTMTQEGVLLIDAIVHNEAKRACYLDMRKNIPPELRDLIEMESEEKPDVRKQKPEKGN